MHEYLLSLLKNIWALTNILFFFFFFFFFYKNRFRNFCFSGSVSLNLKKYEIIDLLVGVLFSRLHFCLLQIHGVTERYLRFKITGVGIPFRSICHVISEIS